MISDPGQVSSLTELKRTRENLRIRWSSPENPEGEIVKYWIEWKDSTGLVRDSVPAKFNQYQIKFSKPELGEIRVFVWPENHSKQGPKLELKSTL